LCEEEWTSSVEHGSEKHPTNNHSELLYPETNTNVYSCLLHFKDHLTQCFPKCDTTTTGGTRKDLKGYATEDKLLKIVVWLALNKETKSSYRHGTAFLLSLIALFSLLSKIEVGLSNTSLSGCLCPPLITFEPIGGLS